MAGVNKAILLGNLGRDPELKHTQKGTPVCQLNLATTRSWFNKDTQSKVEETEWHRISVWGKQAESCNKYLKKGRAVYVEGRLQTSKYEQDGVTKYSTEVIADTVQFLGGGNGQGSDGPAPGDGNGPSSPSGDKKPGYDPADFGPPPGDDDIPF